MTEQSELPVDRSPAIRVVAMPKDTNAHGLIFGGWLMGQVDVAGSIEAMVLARGPVVTVAVNAFQFKEPIHVGDLVSFYAEALRVGNTSITIKVEVYIQRNPSVPEVFKVTEATLTYVAVDNDGRPRPILKAPAAAY